MNQSNTDLEDLTKDELKQLVRSLQFELRGEEELTKVDIIERLLSFEELELTEDDLMNVEQEYNMGLRKSGWMKLYRFIRGHIEMDEKQEE